MIFNILAVTTKTKRFYWESFVQLQNLREQGLSHLMHLLVFIPYSMKEGYSEGWDRIEETFPEVNITYFKDTTNFERVYNQFGYIPLIRPYCLSKYFDQNPHFSKEAFFYIDTDVLFTQSIDFQLYLKDDIIYTSEAGGYTDADYFDSKNRLIGGVPEFMKPKRYEEGIKRDFLNELAGFCGIDRQTIVSNKGKSGAAQYLLKNIDGDFWRDVLTSCMQLKTHMDEINKEFMQSSDKGFQAWCADIHAVIWNLWKRGMKTECPKDFNFAWATDPIVRITENKLFHNAGVVNEWSNPPNSGHPQFYKGKIAYVAEQATPFADPLWLENIINHPISKQFCTSWYAKKLLECKNLYHLN